MSVHLLTPETVARDPWRVVGRYGLAWRSGILAEHQHLAAAGGWGPALAEDGTPVLVLHHGGTTSTEPLLCGWAIEVPTEDGPVSGRCGLPVEGHEGDTGLCEGHAAEIAHWRSMTGWEQARWEQDREEHRW